MSRVAGRPKDEYEEAHRVYKLLKARAKSFADLEPREFGLLYLHLPWALPDVDPEAVQ